MSPPDPALYMVWTKLFRARVHLFGVILTAILVKNLHVGLKVTISTILSQFLCDVIVGHIPRAISAACLDEQDLQNSFNFIINLLFPLFDKNDLGIAYNTIRQWINCNYLFITETPN